MKGYHGFFFHNADRNASLKSVLDLEALDLSKLKKRKAKKYATLVLMLGKFRSFGFVLALAYLNTSLYGQIDDFEAELERFCNQRGFDRSLISPDSIQYA